MSHPTRRRRRSKHQWGTTEQTRRSLLDAARQVFSEFGFGDANVAEIVELANSSVGSLYHHFGGKSELFYALWDQFRQEQAAAIDAAMRSVTTESAWPRFLAGARELLETTWAQRDLVKLFYEGDSPPGFGEELSEYRRQAVTGRLSGRTSDTPAPEGAEGIDRMVALVFASVLGEARREIAHAADEAAAQRLVDSVYGMLERLQPIAA